MKLLYTISSLLIFSSFSLAQGWERTWGQIGNNYGFSIQEIENGNYILSGIYYNYPNNISLIKIDNYGSIIWQKSYLGEEGRCVKEIYDNSFIISGLVNGDAKVIKTDSSGNVIWNVLYSKMYEDNAVYFTETYDSGLAVIINHWTDGWSPSYFSLGKISKNGDTLWEKSFQNVGNVLTYQIIESNDSGFIITGERIDYYSPQDSLGAFILKTDLNGNLLWIKNLYDSVYARASSVIKDNDTSYVVAIGNFDSFTILKIGDSGNIFWTKEYYGYYPFIVGIKKSNDGGFFITSDIKDYPEGIPSFQDNIALIKTDSIGNIIWQREYGAKWNDLSLGLDITSDGGCIISGYSQRDDLGYTGIYVIRTDSLGNSMPNIISGKIFLDDNINCLFDSTEDYFINQLIKITPGPKYTNTDSFGNYTISVDTGAYTIEQVSFGNYINQICPNSPNSYSFNFSSIYNISDSNNFANEIAIYCPLMTVDISTWALRPCMQSTYTVQYCNNGTVTANNAYIEVAFDNDITPVSSTLNWSSQNGNIYTFNIGNIAPQQCGNFYIAANVSCSATLGSTHCIEAHIFPDSICTPGDSSWDKSSVSVEGICVNDSLACFTIYNTGNAMQGASQWRIYENNTLVDTGTFQLNAGDSIVICWLAQGLTIRLEADQRPGHPGNSHPNANVEMCGGIIPGALGFITQVPEDDADEFIETDCRQITASFDPNEKLVKPAGITENHFIDSTDVLEYQINFQNTGTDTAFKVVVRDTLTENLDITTVQSGAGSHPYSFRIYGTGILEWTFNNILLPDSNTNENASHGFVRFKVKQKTGNTIGTLIENRAAIYFDYNAPVITNTAFNTVWKEAPLSVAKIYEEKTGIIIYPNPSDGNLGVRITNCCEFTNYEFVIYNLLGEEVYSKTLTPTPLHVERGEGERVIDVSFLPSGIYIYKVFSSDKMIGAGKLVTE